jgi:hypothetical protein
MNDENEIEERLIMADGTRWIHVWRVLLPGIMQLVWEIEK